MSSDERQKVLISLLGKSKDLDIATMARELSTSEATVRRDLAALERTGTIIRTIGGARLKETPSLVVRTFHERVQRNRREKEAIAARAASLVKPGMVVAIDSGTTGWMVASQLKTRRPLTVITSALGVIEELGAVDDVSLVCFGGQFRRENLDFIGDNVTRQFQSVHVDMAFLGGDALLMPGRGMYANDYVTSLVSSSIASCCDTCVIVMDHTKLDTPGTFLAVAAADIDLLITDVGAGEKLRTLLKDEPFEVIYA